MRRILKFLLITFGLIVVAYAVYFILGRPAIPLPSYRYNVPEGSQLYDIVKATESDQVMITLASEGQIEASADDKTLLNIAYTPETLSNLVDLAAKYALPAENQKTFNTINRYIPLTRFLPKVYAGFYYHVLRLRLSAVIAAN